MKINKSNLVILVIILIIAVIIVAKAGLKVGLKYSENTQININIGKEFDPEDIKKITNEVFPKQSVIIQQVEVYKDMAQITVKDATDEQIEELNTKINEKYEISNNVSDIIVSQNTNTRLRNIVKPYILPIAISFVLIAIYAIIRFRKIGIGNVAYKTITMVLIPQILLFSAYAIIRIPVNRITIILSMMIYLISIYSIIPKFSKQYEKLKEQSDN